jgi:hypothetical protein
MQMDAEMGRPSDDLKHHHHLRLSISSKVFNQGLDAVPILTLVKDQMLRNA